MHFDLNNRVKECNQKQKDLKDTKEDNIHPNSSHTHYVLGDSE